MLLKRSNIERITEDKNLIESLKKQGYEEIKIKAAAKGKKGNDKEGE